MALRLSSRDPHFDRQIAELLAAKREISEDVDQTVRAIIADVIARGDAALIDYTARFDRMTVSASGLRITEAEIDAAIKQCDKPALDALCVARDRIEAYHLRQKPRMNGSRTRSG